MESEIDRLDWRVQASHFDRSAPLVPAAGLLRRTGFRFHYSIKDRVLSKSLEALEIGEGDRILDAGCGLGIMLDRLAADYKSIGTGVDVSRRSLQRANSEGLSSFALACADARTLPFAGEAFQHVVSLDVLEHIQYPASAVQELVRTLSPGGNILIYAVSRNNRFTFNWLLHKLLRPLGIDPSARTCHSNDLLVDPLEIASALEDAACDIKSMEYLHSFFTIIFDQALISLLWIVSRISSATGASIAIKPPGSRTLRVATGLSRAASGLLSLMDRPWTDRGVSNGFVIVATKLTVAEEANRMPMTETNLVEASALRGI